MDLHSVAVYLAEQDIGLRISGSEKNLFVHHMPARVASGVLLRQSFVGTPVDHELPGFYKTSFQVIVRHGDYKKGEALALSVRGVLTIRMERQVGNMWVRHILPRHEPLVYPVSEGDRLEWSINFDAVYNSQSGVT